MNLSTAALALLAWQMLSKTGEQRKMPDISVLLSDDTKNLLCCLEKLSQKGPDSDKMGAVLQMMSNPTVMSFAQSLFEQPMRNQPPNDPPKKQNNAQNVCKTPAEFFAPIENIADEKVKTKLFDFYSNWYVK